MSGLGDMVDFGELVRRAVKYLVEGIMVAIAAYAIPSINDVSKYVISFSVKPGIVLLTTEHTAKPIGNSIRVVEVFITNILIKAAIVIKPAINFGPLDPAAIIICRAILL